MNPITQGCAEYDEDLKEMSDRFCANRGAVWVILCQALLCKEGPSTSCSVEDELPHEAQSSDDNTDKI